MRRFALGPLRSTIRCSSLDCLNSNTAMYGATINKNSTINKRGRPIDSQDDNSEYEDLTDNELPLSSIADCFNNRRKVKYQKKSHGDEQNYCQNSNYGSSCPTVSNGSTISAKPREGNDDVSDNELSPTSTDDFPNTFQNVKYEKKRTEQKNCHNSNTAMSCSTLSNNNKIYTNRRRENYEDSENDDFSDNELFLSSITDFPDTFQNVKYEKKRTEQKNEEYKCYICEQVFFKRIEIIRHLNASICFPD